MFTVIGVPLQKALAVLCPFNILKKLEFFDPASGNLHSGLCISNFIIGRALTNATQCQEFDIMLGA